jgi:tRNA threonylcarbamoyladenosine biosynthesis protein TsaE
MQSFLHALPEKPVVFALEGEMGAGKTRFAKGVAEALGVQGVVSSPTYTLVKEYEGDKGKLVHMDCWRASEAKPDELGLPEYLQPGIVLVIEWASPLLSYLRQLQAEDRIVGYHVFIDATGEHERSLRVGAL